MSQCLNRWHIIIFICIYYRNPMLNVDPIDMLPLENQKMEFFVERVDKLVT